MLPLVSPAESNWEELMITSSLTLLLRDSFFLAVSEVHLTLHTNITFPLLLIEGNAIFSLIALTLCNRWFFCRTSEFKEPIEGRLLWLSADIVFTHIQITKPSQLFMNMCKVSFQRNGVNITVWVEYHRTRTDFHTDDPRRIRMSRHPLSWVCPENWRRALGFQAGKELGWNLSS